MQAVILAAGKGTRLGPLTATKPKGLLDIAGRSLIRRSLDSIAWAEFSETVIVTGYHADMLRNHIGEKHGGMKIRYRHNRDYDHTGSMMSLLAAVPDLVSPVFTIFESDLLYHRDFACRAAQSEGDVMFTADLSGSGDEVYVCADRHGQLTYLGKQASAARRAESLGEFAGITTMSLAFLARYRQTAQTLMKNGDRDRHYEELICQTASTGAACQVQQLANLGWTEVDNAADLERAKMQTWPTIKAGNGIAPEPTD